VGKLLVVVLIESMLRFCKRLVEHNRFLVVNNCILTMATTWLCVQGYGDKKGGASQDGVKTDKGKILKVTWDGSADSYTAAKLEELFQKFGKVEDVVIKTRKSRSKGSAIVVMGTKEAALLAMQNHFSLFPLNVAPVQESGGLPARSTQAHESRTSNIDGTGFSDLEASVFRKLQEAQKRKQCG